MRFWRHIWRNSLLNKKHIHITEQQKEVWQDPKGESYAWRAQSQTVSVNVSSVDVGKVLTGFSLKRQCFLLQHQIFFNNNNVKLITSPLVQLTVCLSTHTSHKAQAEQVQLTLVMFPFHRVIWTFIFKTPLLSATLLSQKVQIHSYLCLY